MIGYGQDRSSNSSDSNMTALGAALGAALRASILWGYGCESPRKPPPACGRKRPTHNSRV
eukprot:1934099-Pyramimonas_sp.AAC.1